MSAITTAKNRLITRTGFILRADIVATAGWKPTKARKDVAVKLTATSFSSRKLQATVDINAPMPIVWEALTDYDKLGTFIPSLVENRCLERRKQGCLLYQVSACSTWHQEANPVWGLIKRLRQQCLDKSSVNTC